MHQWIGDVLGRVTDECQSRGEPLLSALCVSVQGSVGEGYADAVERARGTRPADPDDHAANERLSCYRHWEATGLPRDGGTPLRTAHFKPVRKTVLEQARAARGDSSQDALSQADPPRRASAQAGPAVPALLHPGAGVRGMRLLRLRPGVTGARWWTGEQRHGSTRALSPCGCRRDEPANERSACAVRRALRRVASSR